MTDTIFAPATAPGRAALAVVRISGPGAGPTLDALAGGRPPPRRASLRRLMAPDGVLLDEALLLWMPGPASFTGEDSAELHLHGGPAVVAGVTEALAGLGLRLAEPGEFTRRAFENGRLDLAQAEGVADLVAAETEGQRRQALDQLGGRLSGAQARWREALIEALAVLEAAVDFPDEEVPADVAARAAPVLQSLLAELEAAAAGVARGERVREGYRIALVGAPNAGKSTLLNALAGREAAIVTPTPGTTRDVIEVPREVAGYKVLLADTAGLRESDDPIEQEGVRRARAWAADAALRIWVVDGAGATCPSEGLDLLVRGDLCLLAKADLPSGPARVEAEAMADRLGLERLALAARRDPAPLEAWLSRRVVEELGGAEPPAATRLRHLAHLEEAARRVTSALGRPDDPELAAEDVRLAARALDRITGRIHPEDVLDRVFSSFCIGK